MWSSMDPQVGFQRALVALLVAWFMVVHEILDAWNEATVTLDLIGSKVDLDLGVPRDLPRTSGG